MAGNATVVWNEARKRCAVAVPAAAADKDNAPRAVVRLVKGLPDLDDNGMAIDKKDQEEENRAVAALRVSAAALGRTVVDLTDNFTPVQLEAMLVSLAQTGTATDIHGMSLCSRALRGQEANVFISAPGKRVIHDGVCRAHAVVDGCVNVLRDQENPRFALLLFSSIDCVVRVVSCVLCSAANSRVCSSCLWRSNRWTSAIAGRSPAVRSSTGLHILNSRQQHSLASSHQHQMPLLLLLLLRRLLLLLLLLLLPPRLRVYDVNVYVWQYVGMHVCEWKNVRLKVHDICFFASKEIGTQSYTY
jgi:hypothetical protein